MAVAAPPSTQEAFSARLRAASALGAAGDYGPCVAAAELVHSEAAAQGSLHSVADAALLLAKAYSNTHEPRAAVEWADAALQAAHAAQLPALQAEAWVMRAWPLAQQEQPVEAILSMDKGLALMRDHVAAELHPAMLTSIGLTYRSMGMPMQSVQALQQAADLFADNPVAQRRLRSRINFIEAALDAFDLLQAVEPASARQWLEQAQAALVPLLADAQSIGHRLARAAYCRVAASALRRSVDLPQIAQARALLLELEELEPPTSAQELAFHLVERASTELELGRAAEARALAQRAQTAWHREDADLRLSSDLILASQMAELLDQPARALALYKVFHARVVRNEHAAFDARVAELSATVKEQSLHIEVAELQRRNTGLADSFKQLSNLALSDALTQVANRRGLEQAYAARLSSGRPLVLLMIDLDHFKQVNDRFSHGVGDVVLRQAARLMADSLRGDDLLGRYGGEEFTALLVGTTLAEATVVAERLRAKVQNHDWDSEAAGLRVTLSGGLALVKAGETFQQAIGRADAGLYRAKAAGRNRMWCDDDAS